MFAVGFPGWSFLASVLQSADAPTLFSFAHTDERPSCCFWALSILNKAVNIHINFCLDIAFQFLWKDTEDTVSGPVINGWLVV